jgi:hypothetical protein
VAQVGALEPQQVEAVVELEAEVVHEVVMLPLQLTSVTSQPSWLGWVGWNQPLA